LSVPKRYFCDIGHTQIAILKYTIGKFDFRQIAVRKDAIQKNTMIILSLTQRKMLKVYFIESLI
jgi:hypothetical protein